MTFPRSSRVLDTQGTSGILALLWFLALMDLDESKSAICTEYLYCFGHVQWKTSAQVHFLSISTLLAAGVQNSG